MTCDHTSPRLTCWTYARLAILMGASFLGIGGMPALGAAQNGAPMKGMAPVAEGAAPTPPKISAQLRYAVMVHGYHVLDATASYRMEPWGYGGVTHLYTVGLASWFLTANMTSTVEGRFDGDRVMPLSYDNQGYSRGKNRHVHVTFDGHDPHVTALTPVESDREAISPHDLHDSLDMLSALAWLLHRLEANHSCTVSGNVFDGLRLLHIDAQGPRGDGIPEERTPYYTGEALRCDFTGRQIAGFVEGSHHRAEQASPHPGTAWFKRLQNGRVVPVRIEFQHPKLGQLILVLQSDVTAP